LDKNNDNLTYYGGYVKLHNNWLELEFNVPHMTYNDELSIDQPSTSRGRPKKLFSEKSDRSKTKNLKELRDSHSSQELVYATSLSCIEMEDMLLQICSRK
jgi:hypothetical protein